MVAAPSLFLHLACRRTRPRSCSSTATSCSSSQLQTGDLSALAFAPNERGELDGQTAGEQPASERPDRQLFSSPVPERSGEGGQPTWASSKWRTVRGRSGRVRGSDMDACGVHVWRAGLNPWRYRAQLVAV